MARISADWSVDELLERLPRAARVLARRMHGVGCPLARSETLTQACAVCRQSVDRLLAGLEAAVAVASTRLAASGSPCSLEAAEAAGWHTRRRKPPERRVPHAREDRI